MEAEEAGRVPGGGSSAGVDDAAGAEDGSLREENVVAEVPEGVDLDVGTAREVEANVSEGPIDSSGCSHWQLLLYSSSVELFKWYPAGTCCYMQRRQFEDRTRTLTLRGQATTTVFRI